MPIYQCDLCEKGEPFTPFAACEKCPRMALVVNIPMILDIKEATEHLNDMADVVRLVKRSKTAQHKELMRLGRQEFCSKGKRV